MEEKEFKEALIKSSIKEDDLISFYVKTIKPLSGSCKSPILVLGSKTENLLSHLKMAVTEEEKKYKIFGLVEKNKEYVSFLKEKYSDIDVWNKNPFNSSGYFVVPWSSVVMDLRDYGPKEWMFISNNAKKGAFIWAIIDTVHVSQLNPEPYFVHNVSEPIVKDNKIKFVSMVAFRKEKVKTKKWLVQK